MLLDNHIIEDDRPPHLSDAELITKVWTSPRRVFRYLNDTEYDRLTLPLLFLAGIANAFENGTDQFASLGLWPIVLLCIFFGAIFGWLINWFFSALTSWTGKWLNGAGDTRSLLRMNAYASIPTIAGLLLFLPQLAFFGRGVFDSLIPTVSLSTNYVIYAIQLILSIWSLVLVIIGIAEVQKFSIGAAIGNLLLVLLICILIAFAIVFFFSMFIAPF